MTSSELWSKRRFPCGCALLSCPARCHGYALNGRVGRCESDGEYRRTQARLGHRHGHDVRCSRRARRVKRVVLCFAPVQYKLGHAFEFALLARCVSFRFVLYNLWMDYAGMRRWLSTPRARLSSLRRKKKSSTRTKSPPSAPRTKASSTRSWWARTCRWRRY
ncbi:hypothetical protein C8R46DRAFT_1076187 [Mycena filopes]|nr:hypothetical protein C8R46DRAFT_1076187 [Mycena filopes]